MNNNRKGNIMNKMTIKEVGKLNLPALAKEAIKQEIIRKENNHES